MLSGTHRYSRQEEVVYGRPAGDALAATARSLGAQRLLITTTRSLVGPEGLATKLAEALGPLCVGIFAGVKAHSPRKAWWTAPARRGLSAATCWSRWAAAR